MSHDYPINCFVFEQKNVKNGWSFDDYAAQLVIKFSIKQI